ncbi:MAG: DNA mismatch repair endonuclease MutL [Clostridiales bacterium]|nr:DNA mismatch repair endonuclease MutL [Clostridiales bacterium]
MNKIHLLDNSLINKIAAGEVIERPASVVKELVENSVDAGATSITVTMKDGGTSLISVSDNGCGIDKDDVKQAFLRHATSKLNVFDDLLDIATLGFRGEALASIASVSQLEMSTRTEASEIGTLIRINGGEAEDIKETGCPVGTTITVKNLFYNTPARKKFLKRNSVEGTYIAEAVSRIALGHSEIAFKLINNGNTVIQTSGRGDLKTAAFAIMGRDAVKAFIPLSFEKEGWLLSGFIAAPQISRGNRSYEYFYLNGRYVKSEPLTKGAEEGFKGYMMGGRFPIFIMNIKSPSGCVDVNVHPTKLEVRFNNDGFIFDFICEGVKNALKSQNLIPEEGLQKPNFSQVTGIKSPKAEEITVDLEEILRNVESKNTEEAKAEEMKAVDQKPEVKSPEPTFTVREHKAEYDVTPAEPMKMMLNEATPEKEFKPLREIIGEIKDKELKNGNIEKTTAYPEKKPFFTNYKIIGQVFYTYWLVEQSDKLYIIDQHAAHEKVLYEKFTKSLKEGKAASQLLLEPVTVTLTMKEKYIIEENRELFEKTGFVLEMSGKNTVSIKAVPFIFDGTSNPVFFLDIVDSLGEGSLKDAFELKRDKIATMSCKAAVKGNHALSFAEASSLIKDLLKLENPFNCPHGRPTVIKISKYEIEKMFKRII